MKLARRSLFGLAAGVTVAPAALASAPKVAPVSVTGAECGLLHAEHLRRAMQRLAARAAFPPVVLNDDGTITTLVCAPSEELISYARKQRYAPLSYWRDKDGA